ncbi:MAG TPA: hypothetical protein VG755_12355 [Nannocystaceae bacterium]|nr:hypothetical protein [Nannocystaceae bacterium]
MSTRAAALAVLLGVCNPPATESPRDEPSQIATPPVGVAPAPTSALPLGVWRWLDAPGRVLAVEGDALVAVGGDLLREDDDALVQDGLVANVSSCAKAELRDIVAIAGTFPQHAAMLRATASGATRLFHWDRERWRPVERAATLLATVRGEPLAIATKDRGYTIAAVVPTRMRIPAPIRDGVGVCTSALAEPVAAIGNVAGDLVVWGTGCDSAATIEWFPADGSLTRMTRWPEASIGAIDLDPVGNVVAARVADGTSEILVAHAAGWNPRATIAGHVRALVEHTDGLFAIVDDRLVVLRDDAWHDVEIAAPRTLVRAADDSLWIGTATALVRTRAPAWAATLDPRGCDVATVRAAKPYRFRDRRAATWRCAGGMFVPIADETSWRALWPKIPDEIELGFATARRRRGQGDAPLAPGTPIEPVIARELDATHYGFTLHGDDELAELALSELATRMTKLGQRAPAPICAAPISLPEAELRRRATRTTSE